MRKQYSAAALLMLGGLVATTANAQDAARVQSSKVLGEDNQPVLVQLSAEAKMASRGMSGDQVLRQQLALTNADQMVQRAAETDQLGFVHQKFAQYYQGIRVEHADYTVHSKAGTVESISGDFEKISGLNTTPSLGESAALDRALAHVGARQYKWQSNEADAKSYLPKGELVIVRDARVSSETGPLVLAWKFNVYASQPISRAFIYVDARTGQVVLQDNIIKHTAGTATFATAYSGTRSLANETTTGGWHLKEYTRGLGIETYNCKKSNSYTAATDFVDADNNWTAAEYNNANYDNVAGDAHFGAQATYDYWKNVFGRNSYDNAGAKIKSYVHFDDVPGGAGYENAYWDGVEMTYGDGASTFKPLTALDVCGHEIGHAVCEKTANLTYANESGAMNEGLSDIWGASIEQYTCAALGLTKSTWDIGEDIMKAGGALRSMSNPNLYGQPAYYKGQYWAATTSSPSNANDQGGVHTNSGILNYWYYLIAVGKSGTNEKGFAYNVGAIGISDAAKITFRMESVYMTASSTYANARTYSIQAATDLFGATSAQTQAVTNAWYAVGIGAAYSGGSGGGGTTYCTSNGTSVAYEYIAQVALGSINRTSGADGGYYDGTALTTSIAQGSAQTVTYKAGFVSSAYTEYVKVYIDYNKNGVFTDAGEMVASGTVASTTAATGSFTVPATATVGATRMRVTLSDASATTSCGTYSYGETEDYTVNITAASGGGTTPTYCTSKGTSVAYEYIDLVNLGSINRTSGADAGYYNGTALSTTVAAGSAQTINFSAGFTGSAYSEYVKVYIDYNQNGVFTDAGELVVNAAASTSAATRSASFTVPTTAKSGATRMRVTLSDASATSSCGTYSYGETEDYTVNITGGTGVAALNGNAVTNSSKLLAVYPNPATDVLNLMLPENAEIKSVLVTDVRGARVEGLSLNNGVLSIGRLAHGMYTLTVSDGKQVYHQRFVKE
ncbi:M4 family metallopeptidase [Microvirga sp. STS02]|uniref:M4 family metallopeptidase n=1 Tax=Hymenobacter negativus TaxID=2795026 RepID=UPI0018DD121B|nr:MULTISPECIES: M4 family metallopeptidase [Bacteria]MBH8568267.1 M4 family metallopeptidase [Hymenobacter negativus]MBR7208002.1 M4 family metallopeptidase [Microvirga sp. STS02]